MWPEADRWRAPVGDFPPPWASAWGDDSYGLWADLSAFGAVLRMRWIEPCIFLMGVSAGVRREAEAAYAGMPGAEEWLDAVLAHLPLEKNVLVSTGYWLAQEVCTVRMFDVLRWGLEAVVGEANEMLPAVADLSTARYCIEQLRRLFPDTLFDVPSEMQWECAQKSNLPMRGMGERLEFCARVSPAEDMSGQRDDASIRLTGEPFRGANHPRLQVAQEFGSVAGARAMSHRYLGWDDVDAGVRLFAPHGGGKK